MITINEYLDQILADFQQYVASNVKLCSLKGTHFDGGRLPDYTDIHVQQYYLLRYAYAYSFEYKRMYMSLLSRLGGRNRISVTSIGCGSMLDYWALTRVVPPQCRIDYTGIDRINWSYQMRSRLQDQVRFKLTDVIEYLTHAESLCSDVYIFPKSISEFSYYDFTKISTAFAEKLPKDHTVYFLFSLRTDPNSMEWDMDRTSQLFNSMIQHNFRTPDSTAYYLALPDELKGQKIRAVDSDFRHPHNVYTFLSELPTLCAGYHGNSCEPDCQDRLSRQLILNCQQARWQLFEFRKEV